MLYAQPEIGWDMSFYEFYNGVHRAHRDCDGPCPLHHPSDHQMRSWPLEWRDPSLAVRLCPHGFEHPDPDSLRRVHRLARVDIDCPCSAHFCDGCCHPYVPVDEILADLIAIAESINGI